MVQDERREEDVSASRRQLHDADRAAQSLDNAVHAVFKDVVGFGGFDLAIVSPSDSTFGLSESVTEAHGSGKTWPRWKPHIGKESPGFATLVESKSASVCLSLLSARKHSTTL